MKGKNYQIFDLFKTLSDFQKRKYEPGDVVLLKSNTDEPFVAEIIEFFTAKKKKMFRAFWFYRPGDIVQKKRMQECSPDELLFSNHMDSHNINTIISRCDVLNKLSNDPFENHIKVNNRYTLYVCEAYYNWRTGTYTCKYIFIFLLALGVIQVLDGRQQQKFRRWRGLWRWNGETPVKTLDLTKENTSLISEEADLELNNV